MFEKKFSAKIGEAKREDQKLLAQFKEEIEKKLNINASDLEWEDMLLWHEVQRGTADEAEIEIRERNVLINSPALKEPQEKFYGYLRDKMYKKAAS